MDEVHLHFFLVPSLWLAWAGAWDCSAVETHFQTRVLEAGCGSAYGEATLHWYKLMYHSNSVPLDVAPPPVKGSARASTKSRLLAIPSIMAPLCFPK